MQQLRPPASAAVPSRQPAHVMPRLPAPYVHPQSNLAWPAEREERVNLREIVARLRRGRRLILLITLVGSLVGYAVIQDLTPKYTASAKIMLETQPVRFTDDPLLPGLALSDEIVEGEIQVLTSRELANVVVEITDLKNNPEFNPNLVEDKTGSPLGGVVDSFLAWAAGLESVLAWPADLEAHARAMLAWMEDGGVSPTDEQRAAQLKKQIVDGFLDRASARQVGQAPVITVEFTSEHPQTAALLANALADTYRDRQVEQKHEATRQAGESFELNIARLRAKVEAKENEVERYRATSGLLGGKDALLVEQQMSELSSAMVGVQGSRQDAEARLAQAAVDPYSAPEVLESDLIEDLRTREAEVRRNLAEARGEFGPNHPRILTAEAQLGDFQENIRDEIGKIVQGLRSRVQAERQRETEIRDGLDQLAGKLAVLKGSEVQLRALEREAEALRGQLESLLARAQETLAQEDFQRADARVISRAEVPEDPSFPTKRLLMLACLFASTATGVTLAYALQALDDRFRTAGQARDELGVPVIEVIPLLRRDGLRRPSPFRSIVDAPASAFAEALRNLQVSLLGGSHPPKTLLFTSSLPKEGKTSLTLAFGRFLAMANRKVLVVDCDVRMSSVHKFTQGRPAPGLIEYLLEAATLDEIVQVDEVTGMRYITSGRLGGNPPDLFSSHRMRNLLRELAQSHDVVLIDSAPVLAVADTRCLHPLVDQTVFVVRWRQTRRHVAREALRRLEIAGYDTLSVILNHVDPKSYQKYDYGYQYDRVKSYYGS